MVKTFVLSNFELSFKQVLLYTQHTFSRSKKTKLHKPSYILDPDKQHICVFIAIETVHINIQTNQLGMQCKKFLQHTQEIPVFKIFIRGG